MKSLFITTTVTCTALGEFFDKKERKSRFGFLYQSNFSAKIFKNWKNHQKV
jgi:hypothetical protein